MKLRQSVDSDHKKKEQEQNRLLLTALEKYVKRFKRKERRDKLQIYHDILHVVKRGHIQELKPTRIQMIIETSYDKLVKYLDDLEENELIHKKPLSITEKGLQFLIDYDKVMRHIKQKHP